MEIFRQLEKAVDTSRLLAVTTRIANFVIDPVADAVRHSILHRWLTTEPEPDVIVIDLRETYVVGPVIVLVDRLDSALHPIWRASKVKRVSNTLVALLGVAAESRTGRIIGTLFEPPRPPEDRAR
jgi:hypothetical protein